MNQATLEAFVVEGVGLHTGSTVRLEARPAPEGAGLRFVRQDCPGRSPLRAHVDDVGETAWATTLGRGSHRVATVEHLLAAVVAKGIDNATFVLDGPEVPLLDGASAVWLEHLRAVPQGAPPRCIVVQRVVEVSSGQRKLSLWPGRPHVHATIDFAHPAIGVQSLGIDLTEEAFTREVAWARTFGFRSEIEKLRASGLALGGDLESALVYTEQGVMNTPRAANEPVRHKLLDLVGDLGLLGGRLIGRLEAVRPGHGMTVSLLRALLADPEAYRVEGETPE